MAPSSGVEEVTGIGATRHYLSGTKDATPPTIRSTPTNIKIAFPSHLGIGVSEIEPPVISAEKNSFPTRAIAIATQPPTMIQVAKLPLPPISTSHNPN